jgi:hypothetical protein
MKVVDIKAIIQRLGGTLYTTIKEAAQNGEQHLFYLSIPDDTILVSNLNRWATHVLKVNYSWLMHTLYQSRVVKFSDYVL